MLASFFRSRIKRGGKDTAKSAHTHLLRTSSSTQSSSTPTTSSGPTAAMGNSQSAQGSPKKKAGSVSRSPTTSSSPHMPGADELEEGPKEMKMTEPVSGYEVQGDDQDRELKADEDAKGEQRLLVVDDSGFRTPRPMSTADEGSPSSGPRLEDLEASLGSNQPERQDESSTGADSKNVPTSQAAEGHYELTVVHENKVASPSANVWTPGTYVLVNAKGGTAVDLSGADQRTLIGFPAHMGPNQQWEFIPSGKGYAIRSACSSSCGLYLTVECVQEHAPVVASPFPVSWDVHFDGTDEGSMRISWPNSDYMMDLADWGNATPGTKIQLMKLKSGEPCQLWRYTRCVAAQGHEEKVARSTSHPIISETVVVSDGKDYITTTRTTTTTVITTVTVVTKVPRTEV